jgi:hypothetical protein
VIKYWFIIAIHAAFMPQEYWKYMNVFKKLYSCLIFACLLLPSLAYADVRILDKVEIVQTRTEADIHIDFLTQIRYVRHSPTKAATRIQIFLEFPQLPVTPTNREFLSSPPTDLVPSFTINYPDQVNNSIAVKFSKPVKFRISPDSSGRGIIIHIPLDKSLITQKSAVKAPPTKPALVLPPAVQAGAVEVPGMPPGMTLDEYSGKMIADSRAAMGAGDYAKAIELLNSALDLPLNNQTQVAQELIGVAREKNGEIVKAKAEYELYLKLYPDGEGVERVRQRSAALGDVSKIKDQVAAKGKKPIKEIDEITTYGNWNQYYYEGHTFTDNPVGQPNTHTQDQASLVSSLDITARWRKNQYDSKIVFRNIQTMDFRNRPPHNDRNRLNSAYAEVENKELDYLVRVGRQNGNSGGVLGRFDGAWLRYGFTPKYRINLVAGVLNEINVDYKRPFYGINLDIGPLAEKWSGNVFFINQDVNDVTDRRAVGGEVRYFDKGLSVYSLIDYDILFNQLNIAMVQGNWQTEGGTNFNMLLDHRKSPILQLISSLGHSSFMNATVRPTNVGQAIQMGSSESVLRDFALSQALDTDLFLLGVTRQVTPRWQLGADLQMSRSSGTPGATDTAIAEAQRIALRDTGIALTALQLEEFKAKTGNGDTWQYHIQAVGTDTIFKNDTSVFNATYSTSSTTKMQSLIYSNISVPSEKWLIDGSFRLQRIDAPGLYIQHVISPTLRVGYHLFEKVNLETEFGVELVNDNAPAGRTRTIRDFCFIGYRIDI